MEASRNIYRLQNANEAPITQPTVKRMVSELGMFPQLVALQSLPDNVFILHPQPEQPQGAA